MPYYLWENSVHLQVSGGPIPIRCPMLCTEILRFVSQAPLYKKEGKNDLSRIRTWNPLIRSQVPYPLGHGICVSNGHRIEWCVQFSRVWKTGSEHNVSITSFRFGKIPPPTNFSIARRCIATLKVLNYSLEDHLKGVIMRIIIRIHKPDYPELYNTNTY